jgi:hypothetical protein
MKESSLIGNCILFAAASLLLQSFPVLADDGLSSPVGAVAGHIRNPDWIQHTQSTLDELKGKLNLGPEQIAAWDTWSSGVTKDAQRQLDQKKPWLQENGARTKPTTDGTTPERMARGIERLRAETKSIQEQLVQLEAALARTKTFYNTLGTNQRTIFDLFWHELHHRVSGHDGGWAMTDGPVPGQYECPMGGR